MVSELPQVQVQGVKESCVRQGHSTIYHTSILIAALYSNFLFFLATIPGSLKGQLLLNLPYRLALACVMFRQLPAGKADWVQDQVYSRRRQLPVQKPRRSARREAAGPRFCQSKGETEHRAAEKYQYTGNTSQKSVHLSYILLFILLCTAATLRVHTAACDDCRHTPYRARAGHH